MHGHRRLGSVLPIVLLLAGVGLLLTVPAQGQGAPEVGNPHGDFGGPGTSCVECHPPHAEDNVAGMLAAGQRELCFSCHDGSTTAPDVQLEFGTTADPATSRHPLGDGITCGDCHTPHKDPAEDTALLRASIGGEIVYSPPDAPIGNDFCYSCHGAGTEHDLTGFEGKAHDTQDAGALPASGIACMTCHEPHGSNQLHLTLNDKVGEDLCFTCHTSDTPNTSGGSDVVAAFGTPNDLSTDDGNGIRIYHHPIATQEQAGATRQVECVSCHNSHLTSTADTATTSKIADPTRVNAPDATWIVGWDTTSAPMTRASNMTDYCLACHVSPSTTAPIDAGILVPFDVRLVDDTSRDADGRPHDTFSAATWFTGPHGEADLTCTACHDVHGTSNAGMLRENVQPPDTGTAATITGYGALNTATDRSALQAFCLTCHPEQSVDHHPDQLCTSCHYHGSGRL